MNRSSLVSRPVPLRIGISRCLLGDRVRYDGGHKLDRFLIETLRQRVEWVPVCPEVESGLGTPREAMRLVGEPGAPRLITINSGFDHTETMSRFAQQRVRELEAARLSGFVFKSASPSCGVRGVAVLTAQGMETHDGAGLFARTFMELSPLLPVEEEDRLHDPQTLEGFLERAAQYHRSRTQV